MKRALIPRTKPASKDHVTKNNRQAGDYKMIIFYSMTIARIAITTRAKIKRHLLNSVLSTRPTWFDFPERLEEVLSR